jgi:hypothetical protein
MALVAILLSAMTFSGAWIAAENVTYDIQNLRLHIRVVVGTIFALVTMSSNMISTLVRSQHIFKYWMIQECCAHLPDRLEDSETMNDRACQNLPVYQMRIQFSTSVWVIQNLGYVYAISADLLIADSLGLSSLLVIRNVSSGGFW